MLSSYIKDTLPLCSPSDAPLCQLYSPPPVFVVLPTADFSSQDYPEFPDIPRDVFVTHLSHYQTFSWTRYFADVWIEPRVSWGCLIKKIYAKTNFMKNFLYSCDIQSDSGLLACFNIHDFPQPFEKKKKKQIVAPAFPKIQKSQNQFFNLNQIQ